jgi:hypothetical protein
LLSATVASAFRFLHKEGVAEIFVILADIIFWRKSSTSRRSSDSAVDFTVRTPACS